MKTLVLERTERPARTLSESQRQALSALLRCLESWLPTEEVALQRARQAARPDVRREREWCGLVKLYERLSNAHF